MYVVSQVLIRKVRYAYERWKCTMFYVDTTVYVSSHVAAFLVIYVILYDHIYYIHYTHPSL
jgi:hypothetical protein